MIKQPTYYKNPGNLTCTNLWLTDVPQRFQVHVSLKQGYQTFIKGALSGLRQFLAFESFLKMMENTYFLTFKVCFVLKIFKFTFWFFRHAEKRLIWKGKVNFKMYDAKTWLTNNYSTRIDQYLKKQRQWSKVKAICFYLI